MKNNNNYDEMYCDKYGVCKGMSCPNYNRCKGLDTTKKEENKKTLLNERIKEEELTKYCDIIVKKALKVISCSGSIYAIKLLENKDVDTLEDLKQEVAIQIILDNYTITKNAFKVVRSYIYKNYEKTEIEIFTDETEQEKAEEKASYISFLNNNNEEIKRSQRINEKELQKKLSETEKKVFLYYFKNNMKQIEVAKMLDIKKQTISVLIRRIKEKANKCIVEVA